MKLTTKQKQLLQRFNTPDSIVVVSTYPAKGTVHSIGMGGVASFTKNTILPMAKQGQALVVLAERIDGKESMYVDKGILVVRCWRRNSFKLYSDLFFWMLQFNNIKQVLIEFEFALYGDFKVVGVFPGLVVLCRLLSKQPIVVIHQVLLSLADLSGHLGILPNSTKAGFLSLLISWYYRLIAWFSTKVVVLEDEFATRLAYIGLKSDKVVVIPHGVNPQVKHVGMSVAKKRLGIRPGDKVIVLFGFLTWYKGVDIAVEAFTKLLKQPNKKFDRVHMILAGGESVTQGQKTHYRKFITRLRKRVSTIPRCWITSYVEEEDLTTYFSAADMILLPYRTFMSSSGVFSLALAYGKNILISSPLAAWFSDQTKRKYFDPEKESLQNALVDWVKEGAVTLKSDEAKQFANARDYRILADRYLKLWSRGAKETLWDRAYQVTYNWLWVR